MYLGDSSLTRANCYARDRFAKRLWNFGLTRRWVILLIPARHVRIILRILFPSDVWLKNYVCNVCDMQSNKYIIYRVLIRYQYTQCTRDITGCLFLVKWKTVPIVLSNRVCSKSNIYLKKKKHVMYDPFFNTVLWYFTGEDEEERLIIVSMDFNRLGINACL